MIDIKEIYKYKYDILIIFLGSLLSFYFKNLGGIRIFDFISMGLLLFLILKRKIKFPNDKKLINFCVFFTLFISISFIVSIINKAINIYIPKVLGTYIAIVYLLLFYSYFNKNFKGLITGIKYTIYIHCIMFYFQFIMFNLFGKYIDLILPITGNSSRNIGGQFNLDSAIRASGLYSEPASYSLFILSFMSVYIYYKRRITFIDLFVLLTVLLSMSASGLVYLFVFIIIFYFYYSKYTVIKKATYLFTGIFVFSAITFSKVIDFDYVYNKVVNYEESGSYQYRVGNTDKVLQNLSEYQLAFGIGYGNQDINENKGSTYSSLYISHGYILGTIFLVAIFLLLFSYKTNIGIIAFVFVLFFGTHSYSQIQFWSWIISILLVSKNLKYEEKNIQFITQ